MAAGGIREKKQPFSGLLGPRCDCTASRRRWKRQGRRRCSRQSSRGAPPRKIPWKETHPMVFLTLRRTGGYLSAVLLAALFAALLLFTGAPASAAQGHHKRTHRSTHRRGARRHAKRSERRSGRSEDKGAATGLGQLSGLLPRNHLTEESALQV